MHHSVISVSHLAFGDIHFIYCNGISWYPFCHWCSIRWYLYFPLLWRYLFFQSVWHSVISIFPLAWHSLIYLSWTARILPSCFASRVYRRHTRSHDLAVSHSSNISEAASTTNFSEHFSAHTHTHATHTHTTHELETTKRNSYHWYKSHPSRKHSHTH